MSTQRIELIFFEGCPNTGLARENLRSALQSADKDITWTEWDLTAESTPDRFRRYGSPTVLVNGSNVTGEAAASEAMACRADGAPSAAAILTSLEVGHQE